MPKLCKEDEILNPKTNRCVKRTGKLGRELVAALPPTTTTTGIYIPAYLLQQQASPPTLKQYLPPTHRKLAHRLLKTLLEEILDITATCNHHYRNRKGHLTRADVLHTLEMLGVIEDKNDIPKKEDKVFTQVMERMVRESRGYEKARVEPSVYSLLSRVFLPWTTTQFSPTFLEHLPRVKPSNTMERLTLRYI